MRERRKKITTALNMGMVEKSGIFFDRFVRATRRLKCRLILPYLYYTYYTYADPVVMNKRPEGSISGRT